MTKLNRNDFLEEDEEITMKEIMYYLSLPYEEEYYDEELNYPLYSDDEIYKEYVYLDDLTEEELFENRIYHIDWE